MAENQGSPSVTRTALAAILVQARTRWPGQRRRELEHALLAKTESDIRRLDERIDALIDALALVSDYLGQPDAALKFRSLHTEAPPAMPMLRLVRGQP
jgi:hypothetical protein